MQQPPEYITFFNSGKDRSFDWVLRLVAVTVYLTPSIMPDKGVKILIDPKALMHVIGTKMDFVDDQLRSEFIFINPNSKGQCGCGESFMTTVGSTAKQVGN
ncbi:hypothetical protein F383_32827 [Gossypium arboreum]|uniref:Core domain-containing protein n=1 Tax=Gossypium arboreum TaxID=29729 RepID=A0A0B0MW09_GOSAR|nr:hypothetical protein F383_32827 [Gossypium arboreum]